MSHQDKIVLKLREMIVSGVLGPGERVAEVPVAAALGVSRTPVRAALGVLAREGLVVPGENGRGFMVRAFTLQDVHDAIMLRGTLEGMAARLVAEHGIPPSVEAELRACLADLEKVVAKGHLVEGDGVAWATANERFHAIIVEASGNRPLIHALSINDQVPFASAGAFLDDVADQAATRRQFAVLALAQMQHVHIVNALVNGEGARVEALMREHCYVAFENIVLFREVMAPLVTERRTGRRAR